MKKAIEMTRPGKKIHEVIIVMKYRSRTAFYNAFKRTFKQLPVL